MRAWPGNARSTRIVIGATSGLASIPLLILIASAWTVLLTPTLGGRDPGREAFVAWAAKSAVPVGTRESSGGLGDLEPLRKIVGDARVVCLGASRGGLNEQFEVKRRILDFLVRDMDFTVLAVAEGPSFPASWDGSATSGSSPAAESPGEEAAGLGWHPEEVLGLVRWARVCERDPATPRRLRLYGLDVVSPQRALEELRSYLGRVDPPYAASLRARGSPLDPPAEPLPTHALDARAGTGPENRARLRTEYGGILERLEARRRVYVGLSSEEELDRARQDLAVARAANDYFSAGPGEEGDAIRSEASARNLLWILDHLARGERVVVWATNPDSSREPYRVPGESSNLRTGMGCYLARALGDRLVTVAASFDRGRRDGEPPPEESTFPPADPETLDGALARIGLPRLVVDLRAAPDSGPVAAWLEGEHRLRSQELEMSCSPRRSFDAVVYVGEIER